MMSRPCGRAHRAELEIAFLVPIGWDTDRDDEVSARSARPEALVEVASDDVLTALDWAFILERVALQARGDPG